MKAIVHDMHDIRNSNCGKGMYGEEISAEARLESLVVKHGTAITKYCYNLLWDYHEAHDAAQDVFIKAGEKLVRLRAQEAVTTWLYRIAHNVCMDILRRRRLASIFLLKAETKKSYEDQYNLGISEELQGALDTLPPKDRALVYSRAVVGMEYAELARVYGKSAATLRKRYERARKQLATQLEGSGNNG